ncbi:MAG: hypothetical protein ACRCVN_06300 [Spirochaetia bacterium]
MKKKSIFVLATFILLPLSRSFAQSIPDSVSQLFTNSDYLTLIYTVKNQQNPTAENLYIAGISSLLTAQSKLALEFLEQINTNNQSQFQLYSLWLALTYIELANISPARTLLSDVLQKDLSRPARLIAQAALQGLMGEPLLEKSSAQAMLIYARARQASSDHPMALNILAQVLDQAGDAMAPYALFYQAKSLSALKRTREAISKYQLILSLYPSHHMTQAAQYALAQLSNSQADQLKIWANLTQESAPSVERYLSKIRIAQELSGQTDHAGILNLITMPTSQQERYDLWYIQSLTLAEDGKLGAAIDALQSPKSLSAQNLYARVYFLQKNRQYNAIFDLLKDMPYPHENLQDSDLFKIKILAMKNLGMHKELSHIILSIDINTLQNPDMIIFYYLCKGWVLLHTQNLDAALEAYAILNSLTKNPTILIESRYYSALAYIQKRQFSRAEESFDEALQLSKGYLSAEKQEYLILAKAISAYQGDQPYKSLQFALQSLPVSKQPLSWYILAAASYTQVQDYTKAALTYEKIISHSEYPYMENAHYLLALSHYRAGNSKSTSLFNQLSQTATQPEIQQGVFFWLAHIHSLQEKWPQAQKFYEQALQIDKFFESNSLGIDVQEIKFGLILSLFKNNSPQLQAQLSQLKNKNALFSDRMHYALAKEAIIEKKYSRAIEYLDQIEDQKLKKNAIFDQAKYMDASRKKNEAIKLYTYYLSIENDSAQSLIVSRKLSSLLDAVQLEQWLFDNPFDLEVKVKAPFVLAWIQLAKSSDWAQVEKLIQSLPIEKLDDLERSQINLTQARYFKRNKNYSQALKTYENALNLVISPQQYFLARKERSQIYEEQGAINNAVKEFLLVEQTFRSYPDIAAEALYQASLVFQRHQMRAQQNVLKKTLKDRYPDTPQASRI